MQLNRAAVRHVAAALAAIIAAIYYLIGLGVLTVVTETPEGMSLFWFAIPAGSAFLVGAVLLLAFDLRILWVLGAVLQVLVVIGYLVVSPDRNPHFEAWGITLRIIQVPLFIALWYLAFGPAERPVAPAHARPHR